MAFQYFINRAQQITWNQRPTVAQTIARSGLIRSISRGNAVWRFEVTMPNGPRYSDYRQALSDLETSGSYTAEWIQFNTPGHNYIFGYQGNLPVTSGATPIYVLNADSNVVFHNAVSIATPKFEKGDIFELNGHVYMVTQQVLGNATNIYLHRPLVDAANDTTYNVNVGTAARFRVKCIDLPTYTLFGYDQISWNGPMVFQEVID